MEKVRHKILVLSGKGGVGKSTIAANLAVWLALQGNKVGLLDIDMHGPSVPKLLGLEGQNVTSKDGLIEPLSYDENLKVMSIGFLLHTGDEAVIWRGPMKHNVIKQFVTQVNWGTLNYLIVDCPPGTGDEPLSVINILGNAEGAVVVTTPQALAQADVRKCITFCRELKLAVLGVVENMSGFVCPHCNQRTDIFKAHGGRVMARRFNVPFLGSVPIDADMVWAADAGRVSVHLHSDCAAAKALAGAFEMLMVGLEKPKNQNKETTKI